MPCYDGSIYAKYGVYFDPLNPDTNGNGVLDGDEIFGQSKQQEVETHDEAITEIKVDMSTNGSLERNLMIESMYNIDAMSTNVYAMIGEPFNFTSSTNFESATITFKIDQSKLGDTLFDNLIILWYNEEDQIFEEMPTTRDAVNSTVSTTTTHFSQYMVVDSQKWYANWNNSLSELRKMWIAGTSYQRNLHTIIMVDCSSSMDSTDHSHSSLRVGYKGVTAENIDEIRINSPSDIESYCINSCERFDICDGIINNKGGNDAVSIITFSNGVKSNSGLSYNKSYLRNALGNNLKNIGGTAYLNSALNAALSCVETDTTDLYRLVVITDNNITFSSISSDDFPSNVIFNIVNLGSSPIGSNIEAVAQATGGDVYNAISASDLTYQSGGFITSPERFVGTDSDGDGIPDLVELYGLKPNGEPIGTDPNKKDTDGDGIDDNIELCYIGSGLTSDVTMADYVLALKVQSDPTKADTDGDGLNDDLDDSPLDAEIHSFLLYETLDTDEYLLSCESNNEGPEDYRYSDKSKDELCSMKWINWSDFSSEDILILRWRNLASFFSYGDMATVSQDMIDNFVCGNGGKYSNETLTKEARTHESSIEYIEQTTDIINTWIVEHDGDIKGLEYNIENRDSTVMVSNMKGNVDPPTYDDIFGGLGICVDGTYGNQFEITAYKFDGKNYEYTIKYTIFDIFGLDSDDIANSDRLMQFGILLGFRSWYILQHYNEYNGEYKPFITTIEFEETISGQI